MNSINEIGDSLEQLRIGVLRLVKKVYLEHQLDCRPKSLLISRCVASRERGQNSKHPRFFGGVPV